jgi:hypothetical protein
MDSCLFGESDMAGIGEGEPNASGIGGSDSGVAGDFDAQIGMESRVRGFGVEKSDDTGSDTPSRTAGIWVDLVS